MTREEAIKRLSDIRADYSCFDDDERPKYHALSMAIEALSAERTGEWINHADDGYVECPFCESATTCDDNKDELKFCWHCGAKMGGDTE